MLTRKNHPCTRVITFSDIYIHFNLWYINNINMRQLKFFYFQFYTKYFTLPIGLFIILQQIDYYIAPHKNHLLLVIVHVDLVLLFHHLLTQ